MNHSLYIFLIGLFLSFAACKDAGNAVSGDATTGSVKDQEAKPGIAGDFGGSLMNAMPGSNIYEVNLRQYTADGTINSFMTHLPRLKKMGVDILWFMPMHPISVEKRKQGLGSYYSVADYKKINPEFGTMEDFDRMVKKIHELDMHIIIDWVPNHTGWDHPWIKAHPDWYTQDKDGNIIDPIDPETGVSWGWTDVADLNYDNMDMRKEMISDMAFAFTFDGIPLIYSGQEAGNRKRLRFFEKDTLNWDELKYEDFYASLLKMKKENQALWNGKAGGDLIKIPTNNDENIYAFTRKKKEDQVVVILNLSKRPQEAVLEGEAYLGTYSNVFGNGTMSLQKDMKVTLNAWDFLVLERH